MYLHLGNDVLISGDSVIAILNLEEPLCQEVREIIENAEFEKKIINISKHDKKKAAIVCDDRVYLSPISSTTLYKRAFCYNKEG